MAAKAAARENAARVTPPAPLFRALRRGQCRACKTTDPATLWTDSTKTHCQRCYCAECGRKFLTSSAYNVDRERDVKVCRAKKRCAEAQAKKRG
jgi:hypothetical protein